MDSITLQVASWAACNWSVREDLHIELTIA